MNAAFYGKTKGNHARQIFFPPDEHINNQFRKIIGACGYKHQLYYEDFDDMHEKDFNNKKCQYYKNCENGWEEKAGGDKSGWGCGFLGTSDCKFCCNPEESAFSNTGINIIDDIDTGVHGAAARKLFRGGIMIASKLEFSRQWAEIYDEFSGILEIGGVAIGGTSEAKDNVKSLIGQLAEKGVYGIENIF